MRQTHDSAIAILFVVLLGLAFAAAWCAADSNIADCREHRECVK